MKNGYGTRVKNISDGAYTYEVMQFRCHDRANINNQRERTYLMPDGSARSGYRNRPYRWRDESDKL